MNAPDLFALLQEFGPALGVSAPEGQEPVFWNAYFRDLREYREPAVRFALEEWSKPEAHKNPMMASIFPTPSQLAALARKWKPDEHPLMPEITPAEAAARLRAQADDFEEPVL